MNERKKPRRSSALPFRPYTYLFGECSLGCLPAPFGPTAFSAKTIQGCLRCRKFVHVQTGFEAESGNNGMERIASRCCWNLSRWTIVWRAGEGAALPKIAADWRTHIKFDRTKHDFCRTVAVWLMWPPCDTNNHGSPDFSPKMVTM